jgi:hypothetical protein
VSADAIWVSCANAVFALRSRAAVNREVVARMEGFLVSTVSRSALTAVLPVPSAGMSVAAVDSVIP